MDESLALQIANGLKTVAVVIGLTWGVGFLFRGLELLYWVQTKEYRRDRMQAHLGTAAGKAFFRGTLKKIRLGFLIVLTALYAGFSAVQWLGGDALVLGVFSYYLILLMGFTLAMLVWQSIESWRYVSALGKSGIRRPVLTIKAVMLLIVAVMLPLWYGLMPLVLYYPGTLALGNFFPDWLQLVINAFWQPFWLSFLAFGFHTGYLFSLVILMLLMDSIMALWVALLAPWSVLAKRKILRRAAHQMQQMPKLRIIGITGSYGKSATKEMVSALLMSEFNVVKTPLNNNTAIGLARCILGNVQEDTQVLVAEMGAYTKGEIGDMVKIARPQIAVVTGINEQHLELFGSIERTMKAKFELVAALPNDGVAIFNADNEYCREMAKWYAGEKWFYSVKGRIQVSGVTTALLAMEIKQQRDAVTFTVVDNRTREVGKHLIELPLIGEYQAGNFLAAALVALRMGLSWEQIVARAPVLDLEGRALQHALVEGIHILDDSYSSNPDGFAAALGQFKYFPKGRKIVITRGMLELGAEAGRLHFELGKHLAETADVLILMDKSHEDALRAGIGEVVKTKLQTRVMTDAYEVRHYLKSTLRPGDVVLLEGRLPSMVTDYFKSHAVQKPCKDQTC